MCLLKFVDRKDSNQQTTRGYIKSCSTQLNMKCIMLIKVKMPTIDPDQTQVCTVCHSICIFHLLLKGLDSAVLVKHLLVIAVTWAQSWV